MVFSFLFFFFSLKYSFIGTHCFFFFFFFFSMQVRPNGWMVCWINSNNSISTVAVAAIFLYIFFLFCFVCVDFCSLFVVKCLLLFVTWYFVLIYFWFTIFTLLLFTLYKILFSSIFLFILTFLMQSCCPKRVTDKSLNWKAHTTTDWVFDCICWMWKMKMTKKRHFFTLTQITKKKNGVHELSYNSQQTFIVYGWAVLCCPNQFQ